MNRVARITLTLFLLLSGVFVHAQADSLVDALQKYQSGDLPGARSFVDDVVNSPKHRTNPEAWLLRGFVYKDLYKDAGVGAEADILRDEAIGSLFTCVSLDDIGTYTENAKQAYEFLARTYFNDAARALNDLEAENAANLFEKYRSAVLRMDPKAPILSREIEFKNALGTVYTKQFIKDRDQLDRFQKAVDTYMEVLAMDPENYGANYNLATLYFNRGVFNIRAITADDEIPTILEVQLAAKEFFQAALPYMLKAHDLNPKRRETLMGLEGIYYSLQEQADADKFRRLFEELPPEGFED
ncbi:MAG: hypothetical protein WAR83_10425 [Flavobacteriales bacterium]|jgi:tetratricopeptide (TPR) repeat protein|nr:hypothetical protein [Flavobacteriales bacterium]